MLKFYLDTCVIWLMIFIVEGLLFRETFIRNTDKLSKYLSKDTSTRKRKSFVNTIIVYWIISMIPIFRLILFMIKLVITFNIDELIEAMDEEKRNKNE